MSNSLETTIGTVGTIEKHIDTLTQRLQDKQIETQPKYDFVPKVNDHRDLHRWFCECLAFLGEGNSAKLYDHCNAMRKSIWDTVQAIEPINDDELDRLDDNVQPLVKEMVRIMKYRVVSFQRNTKKVIVYTRTMIDKARKIARMIYKTQNKLSQHIQDQATQLRKEKIDQLPQDDANMASITIGEVGDPSFDQAFSVHVSGPESVQQAMDVLKQKAMALYKELAQLREERVHAVLSHDKPRVHAIDARMRKIKTQTRAIMGARQHFASLVKNDDDENVLLIGGEDTVSDAVHRLTESMTNKKVMDYDLYREQVETEIAEHSDGMALYLGLKTQKEIAQLQQDLQTHLCKEVGKILEEGRQEIVLLNQEMASMHSQLLAMQIGPDGVHYLEKMAKKYRASIAKIQLNMLALFDKR